jgi:hypothetical protein
LEQCSQIEPEGIDEGSGKDGDKETEDEKEEENDMNGTAEQDPIPKMSNKFSVSRVDVDSDNLTSSAIDRDESDAAKETKQTKKEEHEANETVEKTSSLKTSSNNLTKSLTDNKCEAKQEETEALLRKDLRNVIQEDYVAKKMSATVKKALLETPSGKMALLEDHVMEEEVLELLVRNKVAPVHVVRTVDETKTQISFCVPFEQVEGLALELQRECGVGHTEESSLSILPISMHCSTTAEKEGQESDAEAIEVGRPV